MQNAVVSAKNPNTFASLESWLRQLLNRASPAQVARINRRVAMELRRSQSQRIAAQQNPDGSAYVPRKSPAKGKRKNLRGKRGQLKAQAMFRRIRTARFLKVQANAGQLAVGYRGRAGRIAFEHQHGTSSDRSKLPQRVLLSLSQADIRLLADAYLRHLAEGGQVR